MVEAIGSRPKMKIQTSDIFKVKRRGRSMLPVNYNSQVVLLFLSQGPTHLKRASTEKLRQVFHKYATNYRDGEYFMSTDEFVRVFLGLFKDQGHNEASIETYCSLNNVVC